MESISVATENRCNKQSKQIAFRFQGIEKKDYFVCCRFHLEPKAWVKSRRAASMFRNSAEMLPLERVLRFRFNAHALGPGEKAIGDKK